jgi:hypothetical protein
MTRDRIIEALDDACCVNSPRVADAVSVIEALIAEAVDEALEAAAVGVEADLHDDCEHEDCQAERDIYRHAASIVRSHKGATP